MNLRVLTGCMTAAVVCVAAASPAHAQSAADKKKAKELYEAGNTAYNLGNFDEAIAKFSEAFKVYAEPVFLYNIAQSHRMKGDWEKAKFFYKRYLSLKPDAANKAAVEAQIADMDANIAKAAQPPVTPPTTPPVTPPVTPPTTPPVTPPTTPPTTPPVTPPTTPPGPVADTGHDGTETGTSVVGGTETGLSARKAVWLAAGAGATQLKFGNPALDGSGDTAYGGKMFTTFQLAGGYDFGQGKLRFGAGGLFRFVSVTGDGASNFISLIAMGSMRYELFSHFDVRLAVGVGDTLVTGLKGDNVLNATGKDATGPVGSFAFHAELGLEYRLSGGLLISAWLPSFTQASAAKNMTAKNIRELSFGLGVGYAF